MSEPTRCTEDDIKFWLKTILKKHGYENFETEILGISEKGDGFLGDITFAKVTGTNNEDLELVIKCGKIDAQLRKNAPVRMAFENEIIVYEEILPLFSKFQQDRKVENPFQHAPKCYGTLIFEDMEVLVLENLKSRNFEISDKSQPMNMDQIKAVIELYGKLHAISYALRDQEPEVFWKLSKKLGDVIAKFSYCFPPEKDFRPYEDVVEYAMGKNESELAEKLDVLQTEWLKNQRISDTANPYAVILHGDCWNNNFMFQFENNKKVSDVRFLDWQLSRLASPIKDLSYFLFTNLSPKDTEHFDQINDWYYNSLSQTISQLGSDPNKMIPYEEFLKQWKTYFTFGMNMLPGIMKICLCDEDEVPDLSELTDQDCPKEKVMYKIRNAEGFGERCLSIALLVQRKGLI